MKYLVEISLGRCGSTLLEFGLKNNLNLTFFNSDVYNGCKNDNITILNVQETNQIKSLPKENVIGYIYITRDIMYQAVSRYIEDYYDNYDGFILVGSEHKNYFEQKKKLENKILSKTELQEIKQVYANHLKKVVLIKNHLKNKRVFNTTYNEIANNYENTLKSIFNFFNLGQVTDTKKYLVCTHSKVEDSFFEQFKEYMSVK